MTKNNVNQIDAVKIINISIRREPPDRKVNYMVLLILINKKKKLRTKQREKK